MGELIPRRTAIGLSAAAIATAAAGCSSSPQQGPAANKVDAPATYGPKIGSGCDGGWEPTLPTGFSKYDPPIKIDAVWQPTSGLKWQGKDSFTNNPMINRIREVLGIEYVAKYELESATAEQKVRQILASGDLPDVMTVEGTDLAGLIDNQGAAEIRQVWEATASDLVKQKRQYPDGPGWVLARRGEQLFGVPFAYGSSFEVDNVGFIRADLLDKVGLAKPKTVEELGNALRAIKKAGLVEFGIAGCKEVIHYSMTFDPIFGAYGTIPEVWADDGQGKLQYGSVRPEAKQALELLAGWYREGLIDPDFFTRTVQDAAASAFAGKHAVFFSPWWINGQIVTEKANNPTHKWEPFGNPTGPGGGPKRKGSPPVDGAVVFRAGIEPQKIEALINHLNWATELHVNFAKYQQYGEMGNSSAYTENYEFVIKDCQISKGPVESQYGYVNLVGFNYPTVSYPAYQADVFAEISKWQSLPKEQLNLAQQLTLRDPSLPGALSTYDMVFKSASESVADQFLGVPTKTMQAKWTALQTLELETYTKIIAGKQPVSAFDDFTQKWRADGGDQITAEVNEWKQANG